LEGRDKTIQNLMEK